MNRRPKLWPRLAVGVLVLAAVAAVVGVKVTRPSLATNVPVAERIQEALGSGRPTLFVFTYNGDCCETTKEFFNTYERTVSGVAEGYGSRLNVVWLDTSTQDKADEQALIDLASRYEVMYVPSLLLLGPTGEKLWLTPGPVEADRLRADLATSLGEG